MKRYTVNIKVDTRAHIEVEAENVKDAIKKANDEFVDLDLGKLEYVDDEVVSVEDEDGNFCDIA